nr:MAG TPA: hypothetical protein [Caudoviricetes sp.]
MHEKNLIFKLLDTLANSNHNSQERKLLRSSE